MWKIGCFVLMIVLASRHTNGYVEDLLFENDADLDWQVKDIWTDQQKIENDSPTTLLETLCQQYDLEYQNEVIDCNQLQITLKSLKVDQHNLRKREADEDVEGSGEEEGVEQPSHPSEPGVDGSPKETEPVKTEEQPPKENDKSKDESKSETESKAAVEKTDEASPVPPVQNGQAQLTTAPETPIPSVEPLKTTVAAAEKAPEAEGSKSEEAKIEETEAKIDETKPEAPKADGSEAKPDEPKIDDSEAKSETPKPDDSELKKEEAKEAVEAPVVVGDNVELSEAGKGQESNAKSGRKLTQEDLNNQQSGNALVHANGNMIETETKVGGMKPNESIKVAAPGEEPKSGAASEGGVRKDNTLLIGLFVAVLVVGAAAFSYNFVKKRRSKAAAARSEQNGTNRTADPEEGREMKPLMKTEERKNNIEFNDEK